MPFCQRRVCNLQDIHYARCQNLAKSSNLDVKQRFMYQNRAFKLHQSPFDKGVQINMPPRSLTSVPEPIKMPSDGILHSSE